MGIHSNMAMTLYDIAPVVVWSRTYFASHEPNSESGVEVLDEERSSFRKYYTRVESRRVDSVESLVSLAS